MKEIEIETPCGIVKGIREDQINKFLGIRYGTAGRWEYPREESVFTRGDQRKGIF